jgi:xanthine dehydrogenase small subunit
VTASSHQLDDAEFSFTLNGHKETVRDVDPHTTLLGYLRARGLTGAKEGCAEGECGACAVAIVDRDAEGRARFEAVNACLILLVAIADAEIWTVEGIGKSEALHPVQRVLAEGGGSQCGYCTPGFVMALFAHLHRAPARDLTQSLSGNLCRCTGYRPIRDAARALPVVSDDDRFARRLAEPVAAPSPVRYRARDVSFDRPTSLNDALSLRAQHPDARIIAGGTDVVVERNQEGTHHARYLAISEIAELRGVAEESGTLVLGAGLTLGDIEERLLHRIPLLAELLPLFASPLIRARATLAGNLATASPIGDGSAALLALDAEIELASTRSRRRVPVHQFFTGYRQTVLEPDELIVAIRIPARQPSHAHFYKVSKRMLDDISSVAGAFALDVEDGVVKRARLAYGGVAPTPTRAIEAEQALLGAPFDRRLPDLAGPVLAGAFAPISDVRASAAYRRAMVVRLFERFAWEHAAP